MRNHSLGQAVLTRIAELEHLRGNPAIVFVSGIEDDSPRVLYEYLRRQGRVERLDLVLSTTGGFATAARQVALLLRDYVRYLTILVPYRARSAGTLLCLSADELVLGPMAQLGPVDAHIGSAGPPPPDTAGMISVDDIRAFRQLAEEWFGVDRDEDRLQILALLAQRIFPTSLSSLYRSDKLIRQIALELIAYQMPEVDESRRRQVVDRLVGGYHGHDYAISRSEVRDLGLNVTFASPREEALLWDLVRVQHDHLADRRTDAKQEVLGFLIGTTFLARQVVGGHAVPVWTVDDAERDGHWRRRRMRIRLPSSGPHSP